MSLDKLWALLARKLAGEATPPEIAQLERLIQSNPDWHNAIEHMEQLWKLEVLQQDQDVEDAYTTHVFKMRERKLISEHGEPELVHKRSFKWYWVAAASVLLFFLIYIGQYSRVAVEGDKVITSLNEVVTKPKSKTRLQLPDGSMVWLNGDSRLVYYPDFGRKTREVELVGEAFFDVTKNPAKPFVIHAANLKIRVLGTAFNVKAYKGDKVTETSLVRGEIEVTIDERPEPVILRPNDKLVVENLPHRELDQVVKKVPVYSVETVVKRKADTLIAEASWIPDELVFRGDRFEDLAKMMESRFKTHIEISDVRLKEKKFTGSWTNETLEQALEALRYSVPFEYKNGPEGIVIYKP